MTSKVLGSSPGGSGGFSLFRQFISPTDPLKGELHEAMKLSYPVEFRALSRILLVRSLYDNAFLKNRGRAVTSCGHLAPGLPTALWHGLNLGALC